MYILGYGPPMTGIGADPTLSIIEVQPDGEKWIELHCNIESLLTPTYVWTKEGSVYVTMLSRISLCMNCFFLG